jgi:hypothetical protein
MKKILSKRCGCDLILPKKFDSAIVAMEQSMPEFLGGMLFTLIPSALVVLWLVWRSA